MGLPDVWRNRFDGATGALLHKMQENAERLLELRAEHLDAIAFSRQPKGMALTEFDAQQNTIVSALLESYLQRLPDALADEQAQLVAAEAPFMTFAWAGSAQRNEPHYYRIQGRRLLIEYDNTQRGANHIHTVWRDLERDFGGDVLARHYAESAH